MSKGDCDEVFGIAKSFYDALPKLPDIAEASRPDVVSIIQGMCDFAVFDLFTLDPIVEQGIVESMLHINRQGTVVASPMLQMMPLPFAEPTTAADNQYVPLLQGTDHIGQLSPMPPSSTINMPTVPHVIKSNQKQQKMTGLSHVTSSAKQHKVKIGSLNNRGNHHYQHGIHWPFGMK
jgi:hypothetical protein